MPQSLYKNIEKNLKSNIYLSFDLWSYPQLLTKRNKIIYKHKMTNEYPKKFFVLDTHESGLNAVTRWMY